MNQQQINEELQSFRERLEYEGWSIPLKLNYVALYRHILEAQQLSKEEFIRRARRIKPLVRLHADGKRYDCGEFAEDDKLVFIRPCDIRQSYLYNFSEANIVTVSAPDGEEVPVEAKDLEEITTFTCYHRYGGYHGFFRPGADEVLSQIPPSVILSKVDAFEIKVASLNVYDIYDSKLDRHVTTVILYRLKNGLPDVVRTQKVICNGKEY